MLDPFAATGLYRLTFWDADRDRATRVEHLSAPRGAVLLLDGSLLLDKGLPCELTIHLRLTAAALARRTEEGLRWTLPAFADYDGEGLADVVIRCDDPRHPALEVRGC